MVEYPVDKLIGGRDRDGGIIVGKGKRPCSTHTNTQYLVWRDGVVEEVPCHQFEWTSSAPANLNNIAILSEAVCEVARQKGYSLYLRGFPTPQLVSGTHTYLYIYEGGYRGTLYPRLKWALPYRMQYVNGLAWILQQECLLDGLQGIEDTRPCVSVSQDSDLHKGVQLCPPS